MKATHLSLRFGQNKILKPILKCLTIACICMWGKEKQSTIQQVIADMIPLGPSLCMNHEFMNITIHFQGLGHTIVPKSYTTQLVVSHVIQCLNKIYEMINIGYYFVSG